MLYYPIVYFSWVVAALFWVSIALLKNRRLGYGWVIAGGATQLGAYWLHLAEWRRLEGQPDRLYVWIAPLLIALVGWGCWAIGLARQVRTSVPKTG